MESESGHDPMDQFTVPVLADEDMGLSPSIGQRHHELPSMPESNNDTPTLPVQLIDLIASLRSDPDDPAKEPDHAGADRREQREFEPMPHA